MTKNQEIQIVYNFTKPMPLNRDINKSRIKVEVRENPQPIDNKLEEEIEKCWINSNIKKKLSNNIIPYLASPVIKRGGSYQILTEARGFRYTQAFNRDQDFYEKWDDLKRYSLLSLSTHCHILTQDGKILFGTKRNQSNQISGFGGFPNIQEDTKIVKKIKCLDLFQTVKNRLSPEIGKLIEYIDSISSLGITYVNTPALRGTDLDFLVRFRIKSGEFKEKFQQTNQFDRELYAVDFSPEKITNFLREIKFNGKEISKYALGALYLEIYSYHGKESAKRFLDFLRKEQKIFISSSFNIDYFKNGKKRY